MWLNEDEANIARVFNALYELLESIIHELLIEDIINESFQNQRRVEKPITTSAKDSLKCYSCTTDDETCCICQIDIKETEDIIELPCGHKFHGDNCDCPGIMPWLEHNNTCPLCKHELPCEDRKSGDERDMNVTDISSVLEEEIDAIVSNVIIKIMNGDTPDIQDIRASNLELIDRIRSNIHN